jgi:hypothetical protein
MGLRVSPPCHTDPGQERGVEILVLRKWPIRIHRPSAFRILPDEHGSADGRGDPGGRGDRLGILGRKDRAPDPMAGRKGGKSVAVEGGKAAHGPPHRVPHSRSSGSCGGRTCWSHLFHRAAIRRQRTLSQNSSAAAKAHNATPHPAMIAHAGRSETAFTKHAVVASTPASAAADPVKAWWRDSFRYLWLMGLGGVRSLRVQMNSISP